MQSFCQNISHFFVMKFKLLHSLLCHTLLKMTQHSHICGLIVYDGLLLTDWAILFVAHLSGCCITNAILPFELGLWIIAETAAFLNASSTCNWTGIPRWPWSPVPINWRKKKRGIFLCLGTERGNAIGKFRLIWVIFWKSFNNSCS